MAPETKDKLKAGIMRLISPLLMVFSVWVINQYYQTTSAESKELVKEQSNTQKAIFEKLSKIDVSITEIKGGLDLSNEKIKSNTDADEKRDRRMDRIEFEIFNYHPTGK